MIGADPKLILSYDAERKADVVSHHRQQRGDDESEKRKPAEGIRRSGLPSVTICNLATHVSQAAQSQWYVYSIVMIGMEPGPICSQISLMREISIVMTKCPRHPLVTLSRPISCLDLSPDPPIVSSPKGLLSRPIHPVVCHTSQGREGKAYDNWKIVKMEGWCVRRRYGTAPLAVTP
ncbi:hypothetical protein F5Y04DRAFT_249376 [Hypomontagnella monticulosa]|nr:hypothetical protein F5Y04DRAFT_249376 [Hypomontagnella monticulosa]